MGLESLGASVEVMCAQGPSLMLEDSASMKDGGAPIHSSIRSSEQPLEREALQPEGTVAAEVFPPKLGDRLAGVFRWILGQPLQAAPFRSRRLVKAVQRRLEGLGGEDVVVVQLARQLGLLETIVRTLAVRPAVDRPRVVVDLIDTLSLNFEQRARLDAFWLRWLWRLEAVRLRRAEEEVVTLADAVALVCQRDLDELVRFAPEAHDKAMVVPLPVELLNEDRSGRAFEAPLTPVKAGVGAEFVALTGNLGYFVNHLAAIWFVQAVWPLIKSRRPTARLVVAGARPRTRLRELVQRVRDVDGGVTLLADPPDLRAVLREATVAVAPLFGGAGVPVKVLEGWAEGVPMVVSSWAAEGVALPGESSETPEGLGLARTTDRALVRMHADADQGDWAQAVVALLRDAPQRRAMRREGRRRIEREHGRGAFLSALEELLLRAAQHHRPSGDGNQ